MDGLKPIHLEDLQFFKDCFARGRRKGWVSFFPFLFFFSRGKHRELLFCEDSGSLCLFLHKWKNDENPRKGTLDLYFPPVPFNRTALQNALGRITEHNRDRQGRIVWLEEQDVGEIAGISGGRLEIAPRDEEYIYDPKLYREMAGAKFAKMRQAFNRIERIDSLEILPYDTRYAEQCLDLLKQWETLQGRKYDYVDDKVYTQKCLRMADMFEAPDLVGRVLRIDSAIKSFGFAGEMYAQVACGFVVKSDHSITGLNNYMLSQLMVAMEATEVVNGASDLGHSGLRLAKQMLRPVGKVKTFLARIKAPGVSVSKGVPVAHPPSEAKDSVPEYLHNELAGLREITVLDKNRYQAALEKTAQRTWMNYFPSLLSMNATHSRTILLGEDNGSLCVYLLIHWPRHNRLHLYLPPMPMNAGVLHRCFQRINAFNGDLRGRLLWIGESLQEEVEAAGFLQVKEFDREFVYEPASFDDLGGGRFRMLRSQIKKAEKFGKVLARPFTLADREACLKLLAGWRNTLNRKGIEVDSVNRASLVLFGRYCDEATHGRVYEIDGQIRGFAFGGHLAGNIGCSFVHVSDHDIQGLGYYIPYDLIRNMKEFSLVNDAGTGGLEGLAFVKTNLSPIRVETVYRGRQTQSASAAAPPPGKAPGPLAGLKELSFEDREVFQRCAVMAGRKAWVSCFPFLCSLTRRSKHALYWELYRGSICLYHVIESGTGKRLNLYFPPFPFRSATLAYAMARVNLYNNDKSGEITWVEEIDRDDISRLGYDLRHIESEYLYRKEDLENFYKTCETTGNISTRRYAREDEAACLDLLLRWRIHYLEKGGKNTGYHYKRACIRDAARYVDGNFVGEVLLVDGNIAGVCFAGSASPLRAVFYVTITAPEHGELQAYQQASIARRLSAGLFNNSGDRLDDSSGPNLQPAAEHQLYRARQPARKRAVIPMGEVKDKNTALFIMAAREIGLQVEIVSASYSYCTISDGGKVMHVYHNSTSFSDVATRKVTHNKYLSQNILRRHGIPVPSAKVFEPREIDAIVQYAEKRKPIVIKPLKGSNSVGVTVAPDTAEEIRRAVRRIENDKVMVERFIPGDSFRILICKGKILDVLRWLPPFVIGNGLDSMYSLVEEKNAYYLANGLHDIEIDFGYLEKQGYDIGFIPERGQRIFVNEQSEHFVGGEAVRVALDDLHPVNKMMFYKIAEVSGLALAGVDFISEDIGIPYTINGAGINEINSTPHVWPHFYAERKEDLRAVKAILELYFAGPGNGTTDSPSAGYGVVN